MSATRSLPSSPHSPTTTAAVIGVALVLMLAITASATVDSKSYSEYCCCSTDEVLNRTDEVFVLLDKIVRHPYFRFFKVNVHRPCPYWAVSLLCMGKGSPCTVCKCTEKDVPFELLGEKDMGIVESEGEDLAFQNGQVQKASSALPTGFDSFGFAAASAVAAGGEEEYVDLVQNPESNTGYVGPLATRIWEAVYRENCFDVAAMLSAHNDADDDDGSEAVNVGKGGGSDVTTEGTCTEQLIFYRLISGLQTSIATHLSVNFFRQTPIGSDAPIEFSPNCGELKRRVYDHPERIENLMTLYQFVLRAMTRAASVFLEHGDAYDVDESHFPGAVGNDELHDALDRLFKVKLLCSNTFNETKLLESARGRLLLPEMKRMMLNITTLMDCLACEKCRVWGKLQTRGLAAAFKVVMSDPAAKVGLSRGDMVALMNFARQLSFSVQHLKELREQCTASSSSPVDQAPLQVQPLDEL